MDGVFFRYALSELVYTSQAIYWNYLRNFRNHTLNEVL